MVSKSIADVALSLCDRIGARERADFRATSLTTLMHMVSSGAGITLLPEMARAVGSQSGALALRRFEEPAPSRTIVIAYRRMSPHKNSFQRLGEAFVPAT
jgi:LysR family hydrogen peroxide-inducible transcriptional activator